MTATETNCHCSDLQGVLCRACHRGNFQALPSRSGAVQVLHLLTARGEASVRQVWTSGDGPQRLREFAAEDVDSARAYANELWETC